MPKFLWKIAVTKVAKRLVALAVARAAAEGVKIGISVDVNILTGAIYGGLETARNFAKIKFGWDWL